MIEAPQSLMFYYTIIVLFIGLLIAMIGIFLLKEEPKKYAITPGIIVMISSFSFVALDTSQKEYTDAVNAEIESLQCEDTQEHYEFYERESFQEKIKSKYIFECVSSKADMEWLK